MHEDSIPADATPLKRGTDAPNDEDGRDLRLSAADRSATEFYAASHDRPLRCEAQRDEAPDCDQELARQGDDCDAADSTLKRANTVPEPCRMAAPRLVAKPKPGELDKRFAGSAVAGAIDAPIAIHAAALKRRWGKTQIAGDLPPVVEGPVERLPRQDGGEVHADSADRAKRFDHSACGVVLRFQSLLAKRFGFADHFLGPRQR